MQEIIAPLQLNNKGEAVANLQVALHLLCDTEFLKLEPPDADELLPLLDQEHGDMVFGEATGRLVQRFNMQYRQSDLNWVDDATAEALNKVLADLGALDDQIDSGPRFVVRGTILRAD